MQAQARKKRVLIYAMNYAPEFTGCGRYTGEIGEHLAAAGHEVTVVTTPPHYPHWQAFDGYSAARWAKHQVAGATVYRCPMYLHREMRGIRRMLAPLSFAISSAPVALAQIIKRRPHVLLCIEPTLFAAPLTLLAAKLIGAKTVLHVQDFEVDAAFAVGHLGKVGWLINAADAFERFLMKRFDRVITISNRMGDRLLAKGVKPERIEIVRNWVDIAPFQQPSSDRQAYRCELGLADDAFVVLYSGAIGAKQGVRLLIDAARRLSTRSDIVFAIAGEGPMKPELEKAARALPNLRVLGFQPEARFADFLRTADLHVLPQERDAADLLLPSKLGGMLASGRPIVVTADPGTELADFLGDSCTLTPPGDAEALACAVSNAAGRAGCASQQDGRLQRANHLSKRVGIELFTRAVLFGPAPQQPSAVSRAA